MGENVTLDGSRSWSANNSLTISQRFQWTFSDGNKGKGPRYARTYGKPGVYLVRVSRTNKQGFIATAHLKVFVEK